MKYEWKKQEKEIYSPKENPNEIDIPKFKFFMIKGKGNPNQKDFSDRVGVLYSLSYAIRMMPKNGFKPKGYFEYTVYPLEGIWSGDKDNKNSFEYTIMIRQPNFINEEVIEKAFEIARIKKPSPLLDEVFFEEYEEGKCIQMLHIGSYDDESKSFEIMDKLLKEKGLTRKNNFHREIYLSNPLKTEKHKLKTILRYKVKNGNL